MVTYVDSHIHLHDYGERYCRELGKEYELLAVSEDLETSVKTLRIAGGCSNVVPAVGIHPWEIKELREGDLTRLRELLPKVKFLGEVGLDRKFVPETYEKQLEVFRVFLEWARELNLGLSLHAAGAWEDVLRMLVRYDIKVAIFHWFTGPEHVLKGIVDAGYYVGLNPAIKIQKKSVRVAEKTPLEAILTESDGPYEYRGLRLGPELIPEAVSILARIKGLPVEEVRKQVLSNWVRVMSSIG